MARYSSRRPSESERAERRRADRERLTHAAEQLLSSEGWRRWVHIRSHAGLARLSLSNQLLVALARPQATFVAGFKAWLDLGYVVCKGERAIAIIAPLPVKERDRISGAETGKTITFFRTVFVFDQDQVTPIDGVEQAPFEPPCEPLTGDSHVYLIAPLCAFAESLGFTVSFESIDGSAGGWCDSKRKRIVVDDGRPVNAQVRVLVHECIHALGVDYQRFTREQAEVIVDTTTLIVLGGVGLDVSGETIPYVAGWGEGGALDAVTEFAQLIDSLARQVETALAGTEATPGAVAEPLPASSS